MKPHYDCIIVGAGPAGSCLATLLGRSGFRILLLDKTRFPREKTCGDGVSCDAVKQLQRARIRLPAMVAEQSHYHGAVLSYDNRWQSRFCLANPPFGPRIGYVIKRHRFDNHLLEQASQHCDVIDEFSVVDLIRTDNQVCGIIGNKGRYEARLVIGADGANSRIAKSTGLLQLDPNYTAVAVRGYFSDVPLIRQHYLELHFFNLQQPSYCWVFPNHADQSTANVGLIIPQRALAQQAHSLKALFWQQLAADPRLQNRIKITQQQSTLTGSVLPLISQRRQLVFDGGLLVGDAAGLVDTTFGEGLTNAFLSCRIAASTIQSAFSKGDFSQAALQHYQVKLYQRLRWPTLTALTGKILFRCFGKLTSDQPAPMMN